VVVAVGGGFAYGPAGYSHHGTEDLSIMRALPGISVVAPGDPFETRLATRQALSLGGPCYIRLGRAGETSIHTKMPASSPGRIIPVHEGTDALVVSTGGLLGEALRGAEKAAAQGLSVAVWSCPWLDPLDHDALAEGFARFKIIVTVEEGSVSGGLGSAAATVAATMRQPHGRLVQIGLGDTIMTDAFSQKTGRSRVGLDGIGIAEVVMSSLGSTPKP
jgi:transketolase